MSKLILASASARRAEILRNAGFSVETMVSNVDEIRRIDESVSAMVLRLAEAKARAALTHLPQNAKHALIVGADTAVELDGKAFGKPGSPEVARMMLTKLSGKTHRVLTGVAVIRVPDGATECAVETTAVRFAPFSEQEIEEYAATSEPLDKAGGYAIQGHAGRFVERVEGCYFNVVGLPLARLYKIMLELGWSANGH